MLGFKSDQDAVSEVKVLVEEYIEKRRRGAEQGGGVAISRSGISKAKRHAEPRNFPFGKFSFDILSKASSN